MGNPKLLGKLGIDAAAAFPNRDELSAVAKTPMLVVIDGKVAGSLAVVDPNKDSSRHAIKRLRGMGLAVQQAFRSVSRELVRNHLTYCVPTESKDGSADGMADELAEIFHGLIK